MTVPTRRITVGTRGSALALWQTEWVLARLREVAPELEFVPAIIRTAGDRVQDVPLAAIGTQGVFVKELETELAEGRVDLAVHSLKDLPTQQPEGLVIGAFPAREQPWDCLVSLRYARLSDLPEDAVVGTGSLRRRAQLAAAHPGWRFRDVRGNLDTRLSKLARTEPDAEGPPPDAIILAMAGLSRLGHGQRITQVLPAEVCLPAPGQGALAVEVRSDDAQLVEVLRRIDRPEVRAAVTAERAFLAAVEGGCQAPVAAHAVLREGRLHLQGLLADPAGRAVVRGEVEGDVASAGDLGRALAKDVLSRGGAGIMASLRGAGPEVHART